MVLNESREIRVDKLGKRKDLDDLVFISLDCESTGLHKYTGSERSLNLQFDFNTRKSFLASFEKQVEKEGKITDPKKIKSEAFRRFNSLKKRKPDIQLAEIAAIAFKFNGEELGRFHQFIKFDKNDTAPFILDLIHWDSHKDSNSIHSETALISLDKFLKRFPNAIILAHNAPYDLSLIVGIAKKLKLTSLVSTIKSRRFIDTRKTTKIREFFRSLLPFKLSKQGNKIEDNSLNSLIKSFAIKNEEAHTAISDVITLKKLFIKLVQLAQVIAEPNKFGKVESSPDSTM